MSFQMMDGDNGLIQRKSQGIGVTRPRQQRTTQTRALGKGNCIDNGATEQVFGHLKDEFFRGQDWQTFESFKADLDAYITHWNTVRRQVKLKGLTPVEYRDQALREAGASASDEVLLTGFSQGGMTAQALAANGDFRSRWKVAGVLSMGAPTSAYGGIPEDIPVLSVEDDNDVVPAVLAEGSRPANAQTQEVHENMGEEEYGIGLFGAHNGAGYEHMAPSVAQQLGRTGEGREYLAMLDRMMPEGAAVSTVTYEAGAEYYNADPDDPRDLFGMLERMSVELRAA